MRLTFSLMALALTAACGGAGGSVATVSSGSGSGASAPIAIEDLPQIAVSEAPSTTFASMLNDVRSNAGAGPVTYNERLGTAARRHANDMHANNFFSHVGSDGSEFWERIDDTGYEYRWAGENIARGQSDEAAVLQAWQNSTTGHRENNENVRAEHFGLAKAGDGSRRYWVLVLADPR